MKTVLTISKLHFRCGSIVARVLLLELIIGLGWEGRLASAQTGGQGALEGTVTDGTGDAVPNATVVATNQASGVLSTRQSSSAGLYAITPLIPGVYTVTVRMPGFQVPKQENIEVNGMTITGFNPVLTVGEQTKRSPLL